MEYSKFTVEVSLQRGLFGFSNQEKDQENPFHPFREVCFRFHETRICPFCGKELESSSYSCDCQQFSDNFKKMQESFMDYEHKLELHNDLFNITLNAYAVSDISCKLLGEQEVLELGPNFWDDANRIKQPLFGKKTYLLSSGSYDGKKITFYCKDVETKKVWYCECEDKFDLSHESIFLGEYYCNFVPNSFGDPNTLGDYHEEVGCHDVKKFAGWDQFCKELQII